jgi:hypothetical protein
MLKQNEYAARYEVHKNTPSDHSCSMVRDKRTNRCYAHGAGYGSALPADELGGTEDPLVLGRQRSHRGLLIPSIIDSMSRDPFAKYPPPPGDDNAEAPGPGGVPAPPPFKASAGGACQACTLVALGHACNHKFEVHASPFIK